MSSDPIHLRLACHPDAPDERVTGISVTVDRGCAGLLLTYRLEGQLAGLRIPDAPLDRERLWAHTCFEVFFAGEAGTAYREFNFSPNGQWMRFDFGAYRQRIEASPGPAAAIEVRASGAHGAPYAGEKGRVRHAHQGDLTLTAHLPAALLPPGGLVLGLTTVVEHADGSLHYWALRHPPGKPDFHHRDGFALTLAAS